MFVNINVLNIIFLKKMTNAVNNKANNYKLFLLKV